MDKYRGGMHDQPMYESRVETDAGEWSWVKSGGRWHAKLLPPLPATPEGLKEKDLRQNAFLDMMHELDAGIARSGYNNFGFLRDHPKYKELFIKWAMRYLRNKVGFDVGRYSGEVSRRGYLLDQDGIETSEKLTYLVRHARDWIDEFIEYELKISEGFVDITHDYERRQESGIEPEYEGWYNRDQQ